MTSDEEISHSTSYKSNSVKLREIHPKQDAHFESDGDLQGNVTNSTEVRNPLDAASIFRNNTQQHQVNVNIGPLTWNEARHRLKCTLESWNKCQQKNTDSQSTQTKYRFICLENLDIILAILLCLGFVVLSLTLPTDSNLPESFTLMQRIAAILFLVSSLASASILNRWAQVRERDQSIERRRCVTAFLREMEALDSSNVCDATRRGEFSSIPCDVIPRKNVEDVYSTYRLNNTKDGTSIDNQSGQWHRIPSLLLVKGDHIALKVGDTTPARCQSAKNHPNSIAIDAGVRLTMDLIGLSLKLQQGKSTVKTDEELLMLANGVQVFELLETPLESFLSKDTPGE